MQQVFHVCNVVVRPGIMPKEIAKVALHLKLLARSGCPSSELLQKVCEDSFRKARQTNRASMIHELLFTMAANGRLSISVIQSALQEHGTLLYESDTSGRSLLMWACLHQDPAIVSYLLAHGAPPNACDKHGDTPLHVAAVRGPASIINKMVVFGADPNAVNAAGETPLMKAACHHPEDGVLSQVHRLLLCKHVDVNMCTRGKTAEDRALEVNNYRVAALIAKERVERLRAMHISKRSIRYFKKVRSPDTWFGGGGGGGRPRPAPAEGEQRGAGAA
jgi:hypothetical protein